MVEVYDSEATWTILLLIGEVLQCVALSYRCIPSLQRTEPGLARGIANTESTESIPHSYETQAHISNNKPTDPFRTIVYLIVMK